MVNALLPFGLPALFVVSFLAATFLPIASELLIAALILGGAAPLPAVLVATLGNVLGAVFTWGIGVWGSPFLIEKVLRISHTHRMRAERIYQRWGYWSLLMAWAPIVGDPLCFVGGLLRVRLPLFIVLVTIGKLVRYSLIAWFSWQAVA